MLAAARCRLTLPTPTNAACPAATAAVMRSGVNGPITGSPSTTDPWRRASSSNSSIGRYEPNTDRSASITQRAWPPAPTPMIGVTPEG